MLITFQITFIYFFLLKNEPRRGDYTVIEKVKSEFRLGPQVRKIGTPNSKATIEIGNDFLIIGTYNME